MRSDARNDLQMIYLHLIFSERLKFLSFIIRRFTSCLRQSVAKLKKAIFRNQLYFQCRELFRIKHPRGRPVDGMRLTLYPFTRKGRQCMWLAFFRFKSKPKQALVRHERLRQPGQSKAFLQKKKNTKMILSFEKFLRYLDLRWKIFPCKIIQ